MGKRKKRHFRERMYEIIEKDQNQDALSKVYDRYILILVCLSAIPLIFKSWAYEIVQLDRIVTGLFLVDYILRWITADFEPKLRELPKWQAFLMYPFTPMAVIDLLSILPVITTFSILQDMHMSITSLLQVLRIMRVFRCARFLKTIRYSESCVYLYRAMWRERRLLGMVLVVAAMYIFISAAILFSIEPSTFETFFDALYWAAATLTTVGYGDIYPVTEFGRGMSMVSAVFGIAVIAMPSGVITAAFMEEVNRMREQDEHKMEEDIARLLEEVRTLRRNQDEQALAEKIELLADLVCEMQEQREKDIALLQDLSEDLKNALSHGTITEMEKENDIE